MDYRISAEALLTFSAKYPHRKPSENTTSSEMAIGQTN
jgi:hypothetical protein